MICNCSRRCAASALLLLGVSLAGVPAQAAETLYPRFFWRAPPSETPEQSLFITAGAAFPDGGLAVVGYRGDPFGESIERSIYRIDPNGRTIWELDLGLGPAAVGTLVRDSRDGLVFCDDRDKIRRVDSSGRLDWTVAGWRPPPVDPRYPTNNAAWDCDRLLALADGSVIAATVVDQGDRTVLQLARIDAGGTIMWATSIGDLGTRAALRRCSACPTVPSRSSSIPSCPGPTSIRFRTAVPPCCKGGFLPMGAGGIRNRCTGSSR